jgi:hypothetical protein
MRNNNGSVLCELRGPLTLITVGVLFAINNFTPYGFERTWPVILIVFGLITLICRKPAPAPPPPPYPGATPPYGYPQQGPYQQQPPLATPPAQPGPGPTPGGGSV